MKKTNPQKSAYIRIFFLILIVLFACCSAAGPCGCNEFHYIDKLCGMPIPGKTKVNCEDKGDGKCYKLCEKDSDCSGEKPLCGQIGLFNGGDYICNDKVDVCTKSGIKICP